MKKLVRFCLAAALVIAPAALAAAERPNIIFILTDDLGYGDYGVFFQNLRREKNDRSEPWHVTPKLDAMAAAGVQLRHHYCPAPVCAPSRASLLLGVHQGHANVRNNQFDKALENNHTLGTMLKSAGYATAAIGKWGLQGEPETKPGEPKPKLGPADWEGYPTKRGFDFYHGYVRHRDGHAQYPKEDGKEVWENEREISSDLKGCYTTDLFTARAKHWITEHRAARAEQPFFLYLAYATPHAKLQLPPGKYPEGSGARGGVQWLGKAGQMINTASGTPDSTIHPDYAGATWDHDRDAATPEQPWPDVYQRYATVVRRIDDCLGDLLAALQDLGIDQNTLVVFTTDNGPSRESYLKEDYEADFFNSFGPFDGIKRDLFEGGIRVGAVVRWPGGAPAGRVSDEPSQFHDWMPTFAELAGLPPPARTDGVSLLPTLSGKGAQEPSQVYVEYVNNTKTPPYPEFEQRRRGGVRNQMQALRDGPYIGVRYNVKAHRDPFEIYDLTQDPKQTRNLAGDHPEMQERMHAAVLRMRRPDPAAARPYDGELIPAVNVQDPEPGVSIAAYATAAPWLAKLDRLSPVASSKVAGIQPIDAAKADACLVRGYFTAPADGAYTFSLPAGSEALLRLHEATVLDGAFAKSAREIAGTIHLAAGHHPFRFYYRTGGAPPQLEISGPELSRQPLPAKMLSRSSETPSR